MAAGRSFIYTGNTGIHWTDAHQFPGRVPHRTGARQRGSNITGANRVLAFHRMAARTLR
jgi:hypothetical protein